MKMLIDSVLFSESDLRQHNPDGFRAVQEAVESVMQAKALARTPEEIQRAVFLAETAIERKITELRVGELFFTKTRNQTFFALGNARAKLIHSNISGARRQELQQRIDGAITDWTMKRFAAAKAAAKEVEAALQETNPPVVARRFLVAKPTQKLMVPDGPHSPSGWYELGIRKEKQNQFAEAAEAFQRVLTLVPRHPLAPVALQRAKHKAIAAQVAASAGRVQMKGA